jgi:hypothetical protein
MLRPGDALNACRWIGALCALTVALPVAAEPIAPLAPAKRTALLAHVRQADVQGDVDGDKVFEDLESSLRRLRAHETAEVIVRYQEDQMAMHSLLGRPIRTRLEKDNSVVLRVTPAEIQRLAASRAVASIEANTIYRVTRDATATPPPIRRRTRRSPSSTPESTRTIPTSRAARSSAGRISWMGAPSRMTTRVTAPTAPASPRGRRLAGCRGWRPVPRWSA